MHHEAARFLPDEQAEDSHEGDRVYVTWSGGYLDSETAVVAVTGQTEDAEWTRYHVVELASGTIRGRSPGEPCLFGDGTWVSADQQGQPALWALQ